MEVAGRKYFLHEGDETVILCQPCHADGDYVPAESYCETCNEYFCSSCLKFHRKQSMSRNHVIKSKDEMPKEKVRSDPCSELCTIHKKEIVKFYCQGHDEVGCDDCMVLKHESCNVHLVPDVSGSYSDSEELKIIKVRIEQLEKAIASQKREVSENMKATEKMKKKVIKEIKLFRSELNSYLDHAEAEILKEIEERTATAFSMQKNIQDECEHIDTEIKEFQSKLDLYSDKINHLFVTAKLAQKKLKTFQKSAKRIASKDSVNSYMFEPSVDLTSIKAKQSRIGTLSTQTIKKQAKQSKTCVADMTAQFVNQLNSKTDEETKDCVITGLALISSNEIVLIDSNNCFIKVLNVTENKITSVYSLLSYPWDVTVIKPGTIAITLPTKANILFMNIDSRLSVSHNLRVRKGCRGIDHKNATLAVSFCCPAAVHILNMEGRILHEVKDTSIFAFPEHIALSNDNKSIFVSDKYVHAVYELTLDGQLIATVKDTNLKYPSGMAVTKDGTVFVCWEDVRDKVSMILPNTREVRSLTLEHVQQPVSLLVREDQNKLYISVRISSIDSNFIKVFDLK